MPLRLLLIAAVALVGAGFVAQITLFGPASAPDPHPATATASASQAATDGEALFNANCAVCHGAEARGTNQGPPLVHIIYEPNHHADAAFLMAATRGVRAHHWGFGDMPPVEGVTPEQVAEITAYVRGLQKEAGIF